jgi:hypothetical protein
MIGAPVYGDMHEFTMCDAKVGLYSMQGKSTSGVTSF